METYYTVERNIQMLISLMKAHNIKKIVISPGTTNMCFTASVQQDNYFELFSSADERSAAYIACGLAAETGEPVAISCTGATASRNYIPGLTEAYYRKLPILAITAAQHIGRVGHNIPQVIDRSQPLKDISKLSVHIPTIHDADDDWACCIMLNRALLELRHQGGGPVHINLVTNYSPDFTVRELPKVPVIERICYGNAFPKLPVGRIGIYVGAHRKWSQELTKAVDDFCELYQAVVFCDHTSNYKGRYRIFANLVCSQVQYFSSCRNMDVMIHIGDVSGAYINMNPTQVWRVNPDGEVRDTFRKLRYVFEMEERDFFESYNKQVSVAAHSNAYFDEWMKECNRLSNRIPELPFSNIWIAQHTLPHLPLDCVLHLGILNSLRAWNFFEGREDILGYCNTGGFGIDGCISSMIGASFANQNKIYFGVIGDLAFFYDMNVIGNRHVGKNVRLMLINNGRGTEFRNYNHGVAQFGDDADAYMAAAGHYGNKSRQLVKHYAEDLGFEYLSATCKDDFMEVLNRFISPNLTDKPILLEVFTNSTDESDALNIIHHLEVTALGMTKNVAKNILGKKGVRMLKTFVKH